MSEGTKWYQKIRGAQICCRIPGTPWELGRKRLLREIVVCGVRIMSALNPNLRATEVQRFWVAFDASATPVHIWVSGIACSRSAEAFP